VANVLLKSKDILKKSRRILTLKFLKKKTIFNYKSAVFNAKKKS